MKHLCSRWLLLALLLILPGLQAGAAPNEKLRLAVLPFTTTKAADEASAITEELRQAFVNSGRYVVIDRTLTGSILKEWETQQSGMTESDRAIKIGKLFNVQVIVSGKLTEFTSGGWHLSAVMLDSQTGVTMRARTIRHRGDFFSLLDGKKSPAPLKPTRLPWPSPCPSKHGLPAPAQAEAGGWVIKGISFSAGAGSRITLQTNINYSTLGRFIIHRFLP